MSRDDWEETWYNHFITVHGWGVKKSGDGGEGIPYWVVENSWGRIYDNDAAMSNNGSGGWYVFSEGDVPMEDQTVESLRKKNHFVLIADRVAGRGGLEFTSREVFYARDFEPYIHQ